KQIFDYILQYKKLNEFEDAFNGLQIEDDEEDDEPKESELLQKKLKTKLYGESLFNSYNFDNVDEVNRYLVLQEILKIKMLTIAANERLFSDADNIMTNKKTSLKPEVFENLIFLKKNVPVVGGCSITIKSL
ncbi:4014_t:CDS:2, partial [Racocetra fulgida]